MDNNFISGEEKINFDNFFKRTVEGIGKNSENGVEFDSVKNWYISNETEEKEKNKNFESLLSLKISSFQVNNEGPNGFLINCRKGDGISWLAEKTLDMSNAIKDSDVTIDTVKNDKSEFPIISKFIGGERKLIKLAIKESFIENISSSFISNVVIFLVTLAGVVAFIPNVNSVLEQIGIDITTSQWRVIIGLIIFATIGYNIYDLTNKLRKDKKKEKEEFLDKLKKLEKLSNEDKEKDKKYQLLISKVIDRIDKFDNKKIIIIDDIASIDEYGFSQDVLLKYIEKTSRNKRVFWIIFNSDLSITNDIFKKSGTTFLRLTLLSLDKDERKKLCADLKLDKSNASFDTIKEISKKYPSEEAKQLLYSKLSELKESNINLFKFLYLLTLNDFPRNSEYKMKQLIEKMSPRNDYREKDEYIKTIFETILNQTHIENYFTDDKIKKYYEYDKISDNFSINDDISCLIGDNPKMFDCENIYSYGQEYWALSWYFSSKNKPNVRDVKKISHHLQKTADSGIEDVKVRTQLLNAHLFATEKSLSYLQKKDVEQIINLAFKENITNINSKDIQKDRTAQLIFEAFINFDFFPDNKSRFEDLKCEELYKFLKTKEISLAYSLLKENENYSSISDYIIYFLLEQYWERIFFLWIFDKADLQYNYMGEISTELTELNTYLANYFNKTKDRFSSLYLFNLALYIWIDYIRLLNNNDSIQIAQIMQHIELFLSCYKKNSGANISKDDVYQQEIIQESICFVTSITLLLLKKQGTEEKAKELAEILQNLKIIFNEVEIDIKNYDKSIDDIMRFLLVLSLMWKNNDFNVRYTMLSIIRVQLFLFSNDKDNNTNEITEKAKAISQITEQKDKENRLTALWNFSLYLNSDLIKDEHRSSFLFQQALYFTDENKISNIQFEYLYFCIRKCWYNSGEKLQKILKCFVKCSDHYFDKIVEKICEYPESYLHICNCLNSFDNDELVLPIGNTEYNFISFFNKILEQAKLKEGVNMEGAECIWENYKFQRLSVIEKQSEKHKFEEFWESREDNAFFGEALELLFELDENNVHEKTMTKAYNFLTTKIFKLLDYSFNLMVACHFCNEKKNKKVLDEEYEFILNLIKYSEPYWEKTYKDVSYTSTIFLYETLFEHTNNYEYYDKKKSYDLLKTEKKVENFEITDYFGFFYSLWEIFKNDLKICNDISSAEEGLLKGDKRKEFLESIKYNNVFPIIDEEVSSKYLILYRFKDIKFAGKEKMQEICIKLAESNINNLIKLIMQTAKNRKYLERIQRLFEELNKRAVYDDEE